ncbi:MAG: hypothetical protein SFY66_05600 [Oculatellaceae cyanobacterium bins.114]|nr:hypothetical protein [Oculatellaceae cyanobacterium bins.114]
MVALIGIGRSLTILSAQLPQSAYPTPWSLHSFKHSCRLSSR